MQYQPAREIAIAACYKLQPFTDKLNIAGSIRRKKAEVKDIEICCTPQLFNNDMFGGGAGSPVAGFAQTIAALGQTLKGKPDGRYMQILLPEGINLDLFIPQPEDYYRQYAIRTGSADYSAKVIAAGWKAKGWCGTSEGLRLMAQCSEKKTTEGKSVWTPIANATKPPVWDSEAAFFEWLGVECLPPEKRTV